MATYGYGPALPPGFEKPEDDGTIEAAGEDQLRQTKTTLSDSEKIGVNSSGK